MASYKPPNNPQKPNVCLLENLHEATVYVFYADMREYGVIAPLLPSKAEERSMARVLGGGAAATQLKRRGMAGSARGLLNRSTLMV